MPGEFHRLRRLLGYSPQGRKESDTTEATLQARTRGEAEKFEFWRAGLEAESSWAGADASRTVILNREKDIRGGLFIIMKANRSDLKPNRRKHQAHDTCA